MDRHILNTVKADGLGDKIIPVGRYAVRLLLYPAKMGEAQRYGINVTDTVTWETPFYLTRLDRYNMWKMLCGIYMLAEWEPPSPYYMADRQYTEFLNVQSEPRYSPVTMA